MAADALKRAERESGGASRNKIVAASVCGTEQDDPPRSGQVDALRKSGVTVLASNALAARWIAGAVAGGGA